jgi:hypothetical protein
MVVGHEDQQADDHRDSEHVPADGDVVHQREDPVGKDVDHRVEDEDEEEEQPGLAEDVLGVPEVDAQDVEAVEPQDGVEEGRRAVGHRGDDADEADDVEPAGHPGSTGLASRWRPRSGRRSATRTRTS